MSLFQINSGLSVRRNAKNFYVHTFKVADFAFSVFSDAAAGTVFQSFRTIFDTDKFVLRQTAFAAAAARSEKLFEQAVTGGPAGI